MSESSRFVVLTILRAFGAALFVYMMLWIFKHDGQGFCAENSVRARESCVQVEN